MHGILTDYIGDAIFENIKIDNVESWNELAIGMAIYKGSKASVYGNFETNTIIAGSQLTKNEIMNDISLPNAEPFVCSIRIGDVQWDPTQKVLTTDKKRQLKQVVKERSNEDSYEPLSSLKTITINQSKHTRTKI